MATATRKLIDLEPSVIRSITVKARIKNMTFKKYVEELIKKDAKTVTHDEDIYASIQDQELLSLIGIAKNAKDENDEKLNYILSKL